MQKWWNFAKSGHTDLYKDLLLDSFTPVSWMSWELKRSNVEYFLQLFENKNMLKTFLSYTLLWSTKTYEPRQKLWLSWQSPQFESSHRPIFLQYILLLTVEKTKIKKKGGREWPIKKHHWTTTTKCTIMRLYLLGTIVMKHPKNPYSNIILGIPRYTWARKKK